MKVIRCPIHNMPDCSPLLNGCSLPRLLTTASAVAWREGAERGFDSHAPEDFTDVEADNPYED